MDDTAEGLYSGLLAGDRRAAARLMSLAVNNDLTAREVLGVVHRHAGSAPIVGLTGSPGAGKSTLAYRLARRFRAGGSSVGIICVDPTSPFTGGALLGDRVRMQELAGDPGVFIRSRGSRGALGGLSVATNDVIDILDAFGMDVVIVETVGAGQIETEVVKFAHTCVVVTMPGAGDAIQAIKAGILEIGDVFVVNKADREGARRAVADLQMMIDTRPVGDRQGWKPPVIATAAIDGDGVDELSEALSRHAGYLRESGLMEQKTEQRMKAELLGILDLMVTRAAAVALDEEEGRELVRRMTARQIDPHGAAEEIARILIGRTGV